MRHIGSKSEKWLVDAEIHTLEDLKKVGVDDVMKRLKLLGYEPDENMRYALTGALMNKDWRDPAVKNAVNEK